MKNEIIKLIGTIAATYYIITGEYEKLVLSIEDSFIIFFFTHMGVIVGLSILGIWGFTKTKTIDLFAEKHPYVQAIVLFRNTRDIKPLFFPIFWEATTIVFEEFLFRFLGYHLVLLLFLEHLHLELIYIFLTTIVFGIYHLHIYFALKNKELSQLFIILALLLGFFCGILYLQSGLLSSIIIHLAVTEIVYQKIGKEACRKKF